MPIYGVLVRIWTASEFKKCLDDITANVVLEPELEPDVDLGLQLPHEGGFVRQDIQQYAHALMLRRMVSTLDCRLYFVQDGDAGLSKAFLAAFSPEVQVGRVDVATVAFDKYGINDVREALWVKERRDLRNDLGLTAHQLDCPPGIASRFDTEQQWPHLGSSLPLQARDDEDHRNLPFPPQLDRDPPDQENPGDEAWLGERPYLRERPVWLSHCNRRRQHCTQGISISHNP